MTFSFSGKLLGALGLVVVAGAASGAAIGSSSMISHNGHDSALPEAPVVTSNLSSGLSGSLPEHYAIETPEGRFNVAELRSRGLDRDRYRAVDEYLAEQEQIADMLADAEQPRIEPVAFAQERRELHATAQPVETAAPQPPLALAEPVSTAATQPLPENQAGTAKRIDDVQTLASRD